MLPKKTFKTDVVVMGAGLAGITAAIWATKKGAKVMILSSSIIGSGSSFYPGTWGLGLIGPENKEDEKNLLDTILQVGEGMADPKLAFVLVQGIDDAIYDLKALGIPLKEAVQKNEKEFIPCFDHKKRNWHGIVKESARRILQQELNRLGVKEFTQTTVTDIIINDGRVSGVTAIQRQKEADTLLTIGCTSVIIASGGLGGLFKYRLNTSDVKGMGQYLAFKAGASLMNLEFMQIMPGFIDPAPKTIFNEKVFRYSEFHHAVTGKSIFEDWSKEKLDERLEIRSTHGPFTCRLGCEGVDIRLYREFLKGESNVRLSYKEELKENQPEFVKIYFEWLKKEKNLTMDDPVYLGIFAHASNGGIYIDAYGRTGVEGLFACGEATGGMHGADRIGGLSTANALVFGKIAGCSAAEYSKGHQPVIPNENGTLTCVPGADKLIEKIRMLNFETAMVAREEKLTLHALEQISEIKNKAEKSRFALQQNEITGKHYVKTRELEAAITLSEAMLQGILLRKESRGSHYRVDYPIKNHNMAKPIISTLKEGKIIQTFLK
ncbi:FAD-binding protein [Defluviitalea raffinosedens]|uniref:FAD-binding protein n=1 Tax=Defluviitalea raffinosedens TaxID=1450156 RepID=UPI00195AF79F|nr:FAD-binding protein [Defluviitalea raffinosedens]MBM7686280.1 L-aspartate oxidase [Defluviitalea raffinosedens]